MKFNSQAKVKRLEKVPDGLGGWLEEWVTIGSVDCFLAPVNAELQLKSYGFINGQTLKLFTKQTVPGDDIRFEIDGQTYAVRQRLNHRKLTIFLLERST